jgi:hypothetical protein
MGGRGIGRRVFQTIPALQGAFLGLTIFIVGQHESAPRRPLPDIKQLFNDLQENQKQTESLMEQYGCTEDEELHELDKNGRVKKSVVNEYEDFYLGGRLVRRKVKKDGKLLDPEEQKREDGRVEKRIREYEKKKGQEGQDTAKKKKERIDVSTFLRMANFTHPRWEEYGSHDVIVFDFAPNPDYRPQSKIEDLLHKLVGTLWLDNNARQGVRLEAHLNDTFKLAGGLLASIREGASLVIERARTNDGVLFAPGLPHPNVEGRM